MNIDPDLAAAHDPMISDEEWVAANARLVGEFGPEPYLRNLLAILKGAYPRGCQLQRSLEILRLCPSWMPHGANFSAGSACRRRPFSAAGLTTGLSSAQAD
ncbi:hypothetical protein ONA70_35280 [Micromonospora yasonensis]|uniref:hypothetical protein n=1 Tax=Micromonospora yasonensis TaxID=1128667 RepID=UPI00222FCFAE|nr:hypothetical protein [Micromonospora yasonensis]MCW3845339.1 hypothetical protein [Micromonospora yasonensis]